MIRRSATVAMQQEDVKANGSAEETPPHMDFFEPTKAEMDEIREENEKLKSSLAQIMKDRHSLRTRLFDMNYEPEESKMHDDANDVEKSTTSISLGLTNNQKRSTRKEEDDEDDEKIKYRKCKDRDDQLALGLQCKFEEPAIRRDDHSSNASTVQDGSVERQDDEEEGEPWPPSSKGARTTLRKEDAASQQPYAKRARVSVRVRCDAPTMNDGCQWRKYGQKTSKGNPCPRSYYRCTVAPSCPVRKQVQRCFEDLSILIISYEGTHNHPLSVAATAMASATAAAASMLTSGASSSISSGSSSMSSASPVTIAAGLHGTSYPTFSDISTARQFSYSLNRYNYSSTSHPTITLDLTGADSPSKSSAYQFKLPPGFILNSKNSTSCDFNLPSNPSESSVSPLTSWRNNFYSSYGNGTLPYSDTSSNRMTTSLKLGLRQSQKDNFNLAGSLPEATSNSQTATPSSQTQQLLTDAIAKMIASNPSFHSAVAAAITSYVGGGSRAVPHGAAMGRSGHGLQWLEQSSTTSAAEKENIGCGGARASDFLTILNSSKSNSRH